MDWKTLFFSAEGRIGRQAFWIGWLVLLGVNVVLNFIPVIGQLLSLVTVYCSVCIFAKRLHDMGRSGWLQLWPIAICTVLLVVALFMIGGPAAIAALGGGGENAVVAALLAGVGGTLLLCLAIFVIAVGFLVWVGATPGEPGENRFGPPPPTTALA